MQAEAFPSQFNAKIVLISVHGVKTANVGGGAARIVDNLGGAREDSRTKLGQHHAVAC